MSKIKHLEEGPTMLIPIESLEVKESGLPRAGKGLYTKVAIKAGAPIIEYKGKVQTWKEVAEEIDNDYIYFINDDLVINAAATLDALARYANDAEGRTTKEGLGNNSLYHRVGRRVYIRATRDIGAGEEIFVSYGKEYWEQDRLNMQIDRRRKMLAKREV